ncbi:MAG: hypothetical protein H6740_26290 [Alphaproteobacteria bacterium]|nr:hypothetical protein [Alphaproteobacteria bacterium]
MGDFYGVFDENGAFDAAASFHQLYNGDAGDMQRLLTLMDKEKSEGDPPRRVGEGDPEP